MSRNLTSEKKEYASLKMKYNKITLSFLPGIESDFRQKYFDDSLMQFRISFILVTFLYGIFGYLDVIVIKEYSSLFHFIRLGIVVPFLALVFLFSFHKKFYKIWQELIFVCFILGGTGITIMTVKAPENYTYYSGLMLIFTAGYFFVALRFFLASLAGWTTLIIFNIATLLFSTTEIRLLISNDFFFISANLIGMFAAYSIEFYKRRDFFLNSQLDSKNEEIIAANMNLEAKVEERTKELFMAREKAVESDHLKSAFLANMSHEIRTPLNSIIGFSELLNDPDFDMEQKKEFTKTIVESSNNLMFVISDIMDLSMIDSKQLKIRNEFFNVNNLFINLEKEFCRKTMDFGIEFKLKLPDEGDEIMIESDKYRIEQICKYLISNALKFTPNGFVEIGYLLKNKHVEFFVKDSGIGIAAIHHRSVFERFRQLDTTKARKYGGNGLGLTISQKLVKMLGGKIWVESEEGKGSTFYFTIPVAKSQ